MFKPFLLMFIAFYCVIGYSQTNVKIIDLSANQISMTNQSSDSVYLNIDFKIKNIENAKKAIIKFGISEDDGSLLSYELPFVLQSGIYNLQFLNNFIPVINYQARIIVPLTLQQYSAYQTLTVYIIDNNLSETNHLYFIK